MRDQLVDALGRDGGGVLSVFRRSPVAAAEAVVGEHFDEGLPIAHELARKHDSPRVRINALRLIGQLIKGKAKREDRTASHDDKQPLFDAAVELSHDADPEVRVAAVVLLVESMSPGALPRVRAKVAHTRPDLLARGERAEVKQALDALGGSDSVVERLQQVSDSPHLTLPKGLRDDLEQLRREPSPPAATTLAKLFARLPIVVKHGTPTSSTVVGMGKLYDSDTVIARSVAATWVECATAAAAPEGVAFLRLATPDLFTAILPELRASESGLALLLALAADEQLALPSRKEVIERVGRLAGSRDAIDRAAKAGLEGLKANPAVGPAATEALARAARENPGF